MYLLLGLILLPLASATTITDTTFFASDFNYTISVDTITLDEVEVNGDSIRFINLTSAGSLFTNVNLTFDAVANFDGLQTGLTINNVNTSLQLFNSTVGDQSFNATFTTGQVLQIVATPSDAYVCTTGDRAVLTMITLFFALAIMIIPFIFFFKDGSWDFSSVNVNVLIVVFITITLGLIFIQTIASNVEGVCA